MRRFFVGTVHLSAVPGVVTKTSQTGSGFLSDRINFRLLASTRATISSPVVRYTPTRIVRAASQGVYALRVLCKGLMYSAEIVILGFGNCGRGWALGNLREQPGDRERHGARYRLSGGGVNPLLTMRAFADSRH